jgi:hypothetical protein
MSQSTTVPPFCKRTSDVPSPLKSEITTIGVVTVGGVDIGDVVVTVGEDSVMSVPL